MIYPKIHPRNPQDDGEVASRWCCGGCLENNQSRLEQEFGELYQEVGWELSPENDATDTG